MIAVDSMNDRNALRGLEEWIASNGDESGEPRNLSQHTSDAPRNLEQIRSFHSGAQDATST